MKTRLKTLLFSATLLLSAPFVFAHQQDMGAGHHGKMDMQKMQKHMNEMQTVLDKTRVETDPQKRQALLHEHAQKMGSMMDMMGKDNADHKMHNMGKHKMNGHNMTDSQRMQKMEERLSVMEKMMVQMMSNTVESTRPVHQHKKN